jgi:hypothetical protein
VGKMNFVFGSKSANAVFTDEEAGDEDGDGEEMGNWSSIDASSGPVWEVPWRNIKVDLWACWGVGVRMKRGGWFADIINEIEVKIRAENVKIEMSLGAEDPANLAPRSVSLQLRRGDVVWKVQLWNMRCEIL